MSIQQATVFGGSGFIGRYVVRELARAGINVRVAVRRPDRALFLKPAGNVGQVAPVHANVRDDASVAAAIEGADLVVNLVGILFPHGKQNFDAVHREAAGRIAAAARDAGVARLVHVSAIGADEASPSNYGKSKAAGEAAVAAVRAGYSRRLAYMRRTQRLSLGLVSDYCADPDVEIDSTPSKQNLADIFTKPLDREDFERLSRRLGIMPHDFRAWRFDPVVQ